MKGRKRKEKMGSNVRKQIMEKVTYREKGEEKNEKVSDGKQIEP